MSSASHGGEKPDKPHTDKQSEHSESNTGILGLRDVTNRPHHGGSPGMSSPRDLVGRTQPAGQTPTPRKAKENFRPAGSANAGTSSALSSNSRPKAISDTLRGRPATKKTERDNAALHEAKRPSGILGGLPEPEVIHRPTRKTPPIGGPLRSLPGSKDAKKQKEESAKTLKPDGTFAPKLIDLGSGSPLLEAWEECFLQFFGEVIFPVAHKNTIYASIFASPENSIPVFVVYLGADDMKDGLPELLRNPASIFVKKHIANKLAVRFYQLTAKSLTDERGFPKATPAANREYFPHNHTVNIGDSIGRFGSPLAGSIGCFVVLSDDSGKTLPGVYALTCHHVAAAGYKNAILADDRDEICSPAIGDKQSTISNLIGSCTDLMEAVSNAQNTRAAWDYDDEQLKANFPHHQKTQFEIYQESKSKLREKRAELRRVDQFNLDFGIVYHSSGYKHYDVEGQTAPSILDWSLVKVNDLRAVENKLPISGKARDERPKLALHWIKLINDVWPCSTLKEPIPNDEVAKYGRSTELTIGRVSPSRIKLKLTNEYRVREDWIVKPGPGYSEFSKGGDSGSVVFNTKGKIAAMLYGGGFEEEENLNGIDLTFITSWSALEADVKKSTGYNMQLYPSSNAKPNLGVLDRSTTESPSRPVSLSEDETSKLPLGTADSTLYGPGNPEC